MANHFANIHVDGYDPAFNMPYVPAIKVFSGKTVYVAGVTAAGIYHSHPHVSTEFDQIPSDPAEQARMAMDNLGLALRAAGGDYSHVVQLFRFIKDLERNQDAMGPVMARYFGDHRPTSTTVEVVRLA